GGLDALKYMVSSYSSVLTNPNSKEFLEEDVRKVFENGDASFALNWTYMYNMANNPKDIKVAGKVGVACEVMKVMYFQASSGCWLAE
ncbi:hypothetical protein ACC698_37910, partial [Rhizobium johnstonii]